MRSHEHRKGDGENLRIGSVHKVLVCRNRCKVHVHRDKNASLNLLRLVQCQLCGEDRPPEFTRGEGRLKTGLEGALGWSFCSWYAPRGRLQHCP